MIDPIHLRNYVIEPVLKDLGLYSPQAVNLILGTACVESDCGRWLRQRGSGPALGIYQMEPATHDDIWLNYLRLNRWKLHDNIWDMASTQPSTHPDDARVIDSKELIGNLYYATAMTRIHYLRVPAPIPLTLGEQAGYWKLYYNTELGAGSVLDYLKKWDQFVPAGLV